MADRSVDPGEPHWQKSDPPLRNHTRAEETEVTYTLSVWPDPPNDEDHTDRGQIFECILAEWTAQVEHMKEEAASETTKVNQEDGGEDDKVNNKQSKPKPKQSCHKSKGKQKSSSSSKKVNLPDDNLDEYFSLSQDKNSQETADVTPTEPPKESEGMESKDEPKRSSRRNVRKLPRSSGGEGSLEPSLKLKGSPQPVKKPDYEDSSSSSSLSSPLMRRRSALKRKQRNFHHLHPRRSTDLNLHLSCLKSQSRSRTPK